jgi:hypothetical protein
MTAMTSANSRRCWRGAANAAGDQQTDRSFHCGATDLVMTRIAIVNHSGFGYTRRQAEFVHAVACRAGTDGHLLPINDDGDNADAWDPPTLM